VSSAPTVVVTTGLEVPGASTTSSSANTASASHGNGADAGLGASPGVTDRSHGSAGSATTTYGRSSP
jgi:hypothetical protein